MKEINVIGTMQLLAACQKAPSVRKLVVKSRRRSTAPSPRTRRCSPRTWSRGALPRSGFAKDSVEVEGYVRGFARRRPDVDVTDAALRQLPRARRRHPALGVLPAAGGADGPRLRPADAVRATRTTCSTCCARATVERAPGTFNVAGDGVLLLSQAVRRARQADAARAAPCCRPRSARLCRRAGCVDFSPEQVAFLTYGRGIDTTRMRGGFGYRARVHDRARRSTTSPRGRDRRPTGPVARRARSSGSSERVARRRRTGGGAVHG